MRRFIFPLIVLAIAAGYYIFRPGDDAAGIKALFDSMVEASGAGDMDGIMEGFSYHYKDGYGASYPAVKKIIGDALQRYDGIEASYSGLDAVIGKDEHGGETASVNVDVVVTGVTPGSVDELIGGDGYPDNITVTLKKSPLGGWKITEVEGVD